MARLSFRSSASLFSLGLGLGLAFAASSCGGDKFTAADAVDGGGASDTGAGDASNGDGAAADYCDSLPDKHFFCDDFDKGPIQSGWDTLSESRYGNAKLDSVSFRSAPKSFNASTTHTVLVLEDTTGLLQKNIGHVKEVTLDFDMSIDSYGADPSHPDLDLTLFATLGFGPDINYALAGSAPGQLAVIESYGPDAGGEISQHPIGGALPQGAWVHVHMVLDAPQSTGPGHVKVTFDNNTVLDAALTGAPPPQSVDTSLTMGLFLRHAPNLWNVHYDNLIVDKQ